MSSTWKNNLTLTIFGQSHGNAVGMTLDGIPAGEKIDMQELHAFLKRRAPGNYPWTTTRKEEDTPKFLSGLVNNITCGAPITAVIHNKNTRSGDYEELKDIPRPGHADYTAHVKYNGFHDVHGGGHFSGRLTAALCIAGGICLQILARRGVNIGAHILNIGHIGGWGFDPVNVNAEIFSQLNDLEFPVLNAAVANAMIDAIENAKKNHDSIGGIIECAIVGLPTGLGEPMFDGMENQIAKIVFAIPAVKGIDFGTGFESAKMNGSTNNDPFIISEGKIKTETNNHGGILGGITTGMPLTFRTAIKPTPSIGLTQESVSLSKKENVKLNIKGRHDPCIVPRAVPCMVSAAAIVAMDVML